MYSVALMTIIRDKETAKKEFVDAAQKLSTMIFNEAMSLLPHAPRYFFFLASFGTHFLSAPSRRPMVI